MLAVLKEDAFRFATEFGHRPGGTHGVEGGASWFYSGVAFLNYNGVAGVGSSVDELVARVRGWGIPARWIVCDASAPDGFEAELHARGLTLADESAGMVGRIDDVPAPTPGEESLEIVRTSGQFDAWVDVFCDAFGVPPELAVHVDAAHRWHSLQSAVRTYLLVRRRGEAVATGLLHSACGAAGVYGIGVRRAFQKQGLGALATLLTVREGARTGARIAVLQATKDGFPVYQRLGFQKVCTFRSWRIT
jgi:hypothetical protein